MNHKEQRIVLFTIKSQSDDKTPADDKEKGESGKSYGGIVISI